MRELTRYELQKEKILEYLHWNLEDLNVLSKGVLKYTPFEKGDFYTLMPKDLSQDQVHSFRGGCVKSHGIQKGVCDFVYKKQKSNPALFCVFDDFNQDFKSEFYDMEDLFAQVAMDWEQKEVYLFLLKDQISIEMLKECFMLSDCIWHSLMVMTDIPFEKNKDKSITTRQLEDIAKTAQMVVLRAYDQEGYVFWERNERIN